jgi:ribosome-binding factor A
MHGYKRSQRVAQLIQESVANIIRDIDGLDVARVTITVVKLTDDLLDCKIFFSVIGDDEQIKKNELILNNSVKEVRHQLAIRLNLRRTPTIKFIYDDTGYKAAKVLDIIEKLHNEQNPS